MAFDELLAERVRGYLGTRPTVSEKRMFGGLAFLLDGSMVAAVGADGLMVRIDPALAEQVLADALETGSDVRPTVMRGRELRGWLDLGADALGSDAVLSLWLDRAAASVGSP